MGIWKFSFLGFLSVSFLFTIDAIQLHMNQPTERISGAFFVLNFCFSALPCSIVLLNLVIVINFFHGFMSLKCCVFVVNYQF
jgi:hypothetical protein